MKWYPKVSKRWHTGRKTMLQYSSLLNPIILVNKYCGVFDSSQTLVFDELKSVISRPPFSANSLLHYRKRLASAFLWLRLSSPQGLIVLQASLVIPPVTIIASEGGELSTSSWSRNLLILTLTCTALKPTFPVATPTFETASKEINARMLLPVSILN